MTPWCHPGPYAFQVLEIEFQQVLPDNLSWQLFLLLAFTAAREKLPRCLVRVSGWDNQEINLTVSNWLSGTVSERKASVGILSHRICQGHTEGVCAETYYCPQLPFLHGTRLSYS